MLGRFDIVKALVFSLGLRLPAAVALAYPQIEHVASLLSGFDNGEAALLDHQGLLLVELARRRELLVATSALPAALGFVLVYALGVLPCGTWLNLRAAGSFGAAVRRTLSRYAALLLASALGTLFVVLVLWLGLSVSAKAAALVEPATPGMLLQRALVLGAGLLPAWPVAVLADVLKSEVVRSDSLADAAELAMARQKRRPWSLALRYLAWTCSAQLALGCGAGLALWAALQSDLPAAWPAVIGMLSLVLAVALRSAWLFGISRHDSIALR